jgi:hypothetical protein
MCRDDVSKNKTRDSRASIVLGYMGVDELQLHIDKEREVLVAGENLYRGNNLSF